MGILSHSQLQAYTLNFAETLLYYLKKFNTLAFGNTQLEKIASEKNITNMLNIIAMLPEPKAEAVIRLNIPCHKIVVDRFLPDFSNNQFKSIAPDNKLNANPIIIPMFMFEYVGK